ncbi:hypothetical protein [Nitrosopumilus sp.]|uniref:hypothetical protein n=1 Tax=Nitrosopumilus sp. TaxID=2024843 RepID=UPI003D0B85DD
MSKFTFIGDDYLKVHDYMNELDTSEQIMLNHTLQGMLISPREIAYMSGQWKMLMAQAASIHGINKVLKSDPKYEKILTDSKRRHPILVYKHGKVLGGIANKLEKKPSYLA